MAKPTKAEAAERLKTAEAAIVDAMEALDVSVHVCSSCRCQRYQNVEDFRIAQELNGALGRVRNATNAIKARAAGETR